MGKADPANPQTLIVGLGELAKIARYHALVEAWIDAATPCVAK